MTLLDLPTGHAPIVTQISAAGGAHTLSVDRVHDDTHAQFVGGEPDHLTGPPSLAAHGVRGGEVQAPPTEAVDDSITNGELPRLADPLLTLRAAILDDLERVRIANTNRISVLTRPLGQVDVDGEERGWGLPADAPEVAALQTLVAGLEALEHRAVLDLQRAMRRHALGSWVKATIGVGEKQGARLLAAIGDPYWNTLHNRPRTVSELWAYCGLHTLPVGLGGPDTHGSDADGGKLPGGGEGRKPLDIPSSDANVAARRRKGQKSNWSTTAKTRAYLIAESCMKQARSPYRAVYDTRRAHTAVTHPDWTTGHSHSDALRITSKAILRDLWIAARDLHAKGA